LHQPLRGLNGIDVGHAFVSANADYARESHGDAAGVSWAGLQAIEGDFEHGVRLDLVISTMLPDDSAQKMIG
jgi:hypothetical protein